MVDALISFDGKDAVVTALERARVGARDVRVRVARAAVSRAPEQAPGAPFAVLGTDFVGVVTERGTQVTEWKVGDRVWGSVRSGACAEELVVNALGIVRVPAGVDDDLVSFLPISGLAAMASIDLAPISAGGYALVSAASGALSCVLAGLIRAGDGIPVATCRHPELAAELRAVGFESVLCGPSCPDMAALSAATDGRGVEVIYDCGTSQTTTFSTLSLCPDVPVVRTRASEVTGFRPRASDVPMRLTEWLASPVDRAVTAGAELLRLLADGQVTVPLARYPLARGTEAWNLIRSRRYVGKVIIEMPDATVS